MEGARILVTGATGQVGLPVATRLAKTNDVVAVARFSDPEVKARLEAAGVTCVTANFGQAELGDTPDDVDYVLNFAVVRTGKFDRDITANCEATGLLMQRCASAKAFLHCSSTAVYEPKGREPIKETDPLADNHRVLFPTYSIVKIAAEAVARTGARVHGLPTTIARLNVPYGDNGGWPAFHLVMMKNGDPIQVHADGSHYSPIHDDDIIAAIPKLLEAATVPATIVNLGGDTAVSVEEWCTYMGELTGLTPTFVTTADTIPSVVVDTTKMRELVGPCSVDWKEGFRRLVDATATWPEPTG